MKIIVISFYLRLENFILRLKYYMAISEYSYTLHPNTVMFMKIFLVLLFYILLLDQVNTNFLN